MNQPTIETLEQISKGSLVALVAYLDDCFTSAINELLVCTPEQLPELRAEARTLSAISELVTTAADVLHDSKGIPETGSPEQVIL